MDNKKLKKCNKKAKENKEEIKDLKENYKIGIKYYKEVENKQK